MPNVGPLEIIVVLIIALVIFGPKRLPELGRSAGKGLREFKNSVTGKDDDDDEDDVPRLERSRERATPEAHDDEPAPLEGEVVHDRKT
jgi:sec-independent protein translocase protein TatA